MERSRRWLLGLTALLMGCPPPPADPTPMGSTGDPAQNPPQPPILGSVCEQVSAGQGADESAGATECPEVTTDALRIEWSNGHTFRNRSRSCVHFAARNLLGEEIRVEYEASTNMVGSDYSRSLPMPPHEERRTYSANDGGITEINLQIAYDLNVLEGGGWAEVHVRGRLLSPVETPMMELPMVEVTSRLDEYGRIDDIDYREQ